MPFKGIRNIIKSMKMPTNYHILSFKGIWTIVILQSIIMFRETFGRS